MEYYTCTYEHVLHGQGLCKEGWLKHADHCYFFNQSAATWTNAKVFQFGGGIMNCIFEIFTYQLILKDCLF